MRPAVERPYYSSLDGLRGIAIILVICCHHFDFIPYFSFGWVGVDLFFVLSGFLITDILLRTKERKNFLGNFYIRRILRIFPLYYGIILLFFFVTSSVSALQYQHHYYFDNPSFTGFHLQNVLYILHRKPSDFLLLNHFWSLSVEEQFYLVWPFLVMACRSNKTLSRVAISLIVLCIIARTFSWLYFGDGYTNFYFQYMTRLDGLCIGSLIAIMKFSEPLSFVKKIIRVGLVFFGVQIIASAFSHLVFRSFPAFSIFGYTSISMLFGLLLVMLITTRFSFLNRMFEWKPLRELGKISYGLYVFHWPLLVVSKLYILPAFERAGYSYFNSLVAASVLSLLAALAVSALSYRYFEKRILALKEDLTMERMSGFLRGRIIFPWRFRGSKA